MIRKSLWKIGINKKYLLMPTVFRSLSSFSTHEVRKCFINYFEKHNHIHVPSSSVLPDSSDDTLMFTNAGMNQFKSIFLGSMDNRWSHLQRVVNYQKCIRAGGKHNDLDDVGRDLYHQTFFEMLGSWSFNDGYSREMACHLAWNFLTEVLNIDSSRLYVSYFGGNEMLGISADIKCKKTWLNLGIPESHIIPFDKENFWEMGSVGPCGPSTEIHYDRKQGRKNAQHLVNVDVSLVELWNIVFMSYMRLPNGQLKILPKEHIDTGMGLERLVSVVQNVPSNFDIDIFVPILNRICELSSGSAYTGLVADEDINMKDTAYRIVADHIRAVTIALSDGALPGPSKIGFIVRKLLRRGCWQSTKMLGMDRGAFAELVPTVVETLKYAYPELSSNWESIQTLIRKEEDQFWKILDKGRNIIDTMVLKMPKNTMAFSGDDTWKLHDTYGIPIEITHEVVKESGLIIDMDRFNALKDKAKKLSKKAYSPSIPISISDVPSFTDSAKYIYKLSGNVYVFPSLRTRILALFSTNNTRVSSLKDYGTIVIEDCQFYANEGGQKSDGGYLEIDGEPVFNVCSVNKVNSITVLTGEVLGNAELVEGSEITQKINVNRRIALMRAHTATHLLNWSLRRVGAGEGQRGSAIDEDELRFDYACGENAGEDDVITDVESLIRNVISQCQPVIMEKVSIDDAKSIPALQSEFKKDKIYPSVIQLVRVGAELNDDSVAVECCSGTHVLNTSSLFDFVITGDRSSAKGVRRIYALTGEKAVFSRKYGRDVLEKVMAFRGDLTMQRKLVELQKTIKWSQIPLSDMKEIKMKLKKISKMKSL